MGRNRRADAGETLVELLVTITIMSVAGVAIMAGLQMTVLGATLGRGQANSDAYVRSAAEAIQNSVDAGSYATCPNAVSAYTTVGQAAVDKASGLTGVYIFSISSVQGWSNPSGWGQCPATPTPYAERLAMKVSSPGTAQHQAIEQLTAVVRKPCTNAFPSPC